MASLSAFTRYVALEVQGCPTPIIEDAVLRAAQSLCERSDRMTSVIPITMVADQGDYTLTMPDGYVLSRVEGVRSAAYPRGLGVTNKREAAGITASGIPKDYYVNGDNSLALVPHPATADEIMSVDVVLKPSMSSTTLHDALLNDCRDIIVAGAKSILMDMTGQPWFNQEKAIVNAGLFNDGVIKDSIAIMTGRAGGSLTVRPRKF